jgi:adenylosuccinate synthase
MKSKTLVLIGLQWGDEGKGKIVDILDADFVIRFQGGNNAGHTIEFEDQKIVLHQIPSGILKPHCEVFLGSGMVIDLFQLSCEILALEKKGIACKKRIFISELAHLILPIHRIKDILQEKKRGKNSIGTTQKGIGPAYTDKVIRRGIRVGDIEETQDFQEYFVKKTKIEYEEIMQDCQKYNLELPDILSSYQELIANYKKIQTMLKDPLLFVAEKKKQKKKILLEGAQGSLLDLDYGSYPFVTSSNTVAGSGAIGSGLSFQDLDEVLGLFKAYSTRVGQGPFPTELSTAEGEALQKQGNEFGATTGRLRRCGWLDLCLIRKSMLASGVDYLGLMKLDVLDNFEEIKVCTHYEFRGKKIIIPPNNTAAWRDLKPVYKVFRGWLQNTSLVKKDKDLPKNCKIYIDFLQKELKKPIVFISTSPKRENYILRKTFF